MAFQERPYRGQLADDLLIADLLDAQPEHARHLADQPWRLSSPDAQSGRYARLWQETGGQLAGFAAWQAPWAALDLYVRDGPHRRVVIDAIFGWAYSLFRELDDERGFALPYWLECRTDDRATVALAAPELKQKLRDNTTWAIERGAFGVPTLLIGNEAFWGHDAFDMALDYLHDPQAFADPEMRRFESLPYGAVRPR